MTLDRVEIARRPLLNFAITKLVPLAIMVAMLTNLTACSFFASSTQIISVTSDPPGAHVTINGERVGPAPVQHAVARNQTSAITVTKEGYDTVTRSTTKGLSTTGILDIVGTLVFLVPILGLLAPGAWEQSPSNFSVVLYKREGASLETPKTIDLARAGIVLDADLAENEPAVAGE